MCGFFKKHKIMALSARIFYFFDILLYTVCMKWYNIVKF
nr:MAG TPA: hypothetical protein [Caudoviricetes sp.]